MKLVIGRTSTGRPELLERSTKSLFENIRFNGEIIHVLHEDYVDPEKSEQCVSWAKASGKFNEVMVANPPAYHSEAIRKLLRYALLQDAPYYFNFEDDWLLRRKIDLNEVVSLMENNPGINQIAFHKRKPIDRKDWKKWQVKIDGINLITNIHWTVIPSVWRMGFAYQFLAQDIVPSNNAAANFNKIFKTQNQPAHWVIGNVGSYFLGKIGDDDSHYCVHIDDKQSRRLQSDDEYC